MSPEPFDLLSARYSVTPFCYFDGKWWQYFFRQRTAKKEAKGKQVWRLNRRTGGWFKV